MFRERHDASHKKPLRPARVRVIGHLTYPVQFPEYER
jgi:hypothetical protein